MDKSGRKKYITERRGRSSFERQSIFSFCTCQWNELMDGWMDELMNEFCCHCFSAQ
jgi:hypothetical protein